MYLLKLATRPWRESPFSQVFTSIALGILLFLSGFLFWMQRGMKPVIDRLQGEQVITAYLDPSVSSADEAQIVDRIRATVGSHAEIELVGVDRFLSHLRGDYPELANELEDLGSEMQTVIPRYVSIAGMFPSSTLGEVKSIGGVQSAETSVDRFRNVIGAFHALSWIATLLTFGLGLALMTGLVHLGRTNAYLHQSASSLMKLMGATPSTLRAPGLISGSIVGFLGGLFAAVGWTLFGASMAGHVRALSPLLSPMPPTGSGFALGLLALGLLLGALSGVLGNWLGDTSAGRARSSAQAGG